MAAERQAPNNHHNHVSFDSDNLDSIDTSTTTSDPLDELKRHAAEVLAPLVLVDLSLSATGTAAAKRVRLQEEEEQGQVDGLENNINNNNTMTGQPSSSSQAQAHAGPSTSTASSITNSNGKRRSKAPPSSNSAAATGDSSSNMDGNTNNPKDAGPKAKRKKVSKACIFCKRSHMTCTENRPCERCIKRDIAHLCQDGPITGPPSSSSNNKQNNTNLNTAENETNEAVIPGATSVSHPNPSSSSSRVPGKDMSPLTSTAGNTLPSSSQQRDDYHPNTTSAFVAPSSTSSYQQQQHGPPSTHSDNNDTNPTSKDRRKSSSTHYASLPTPTSASTSLLFGGNMEDSNNQVGTSSANNARPGDAAVGSHGSHSQSPAFGNANGGQNSLSLDISGGTNIQQQQRSGSNGLPSTSSASSANINNGNNNNNNNSNPIPTPASTTTQSHPLTTEERTWNPFDILSQAYDYQYPSNNQSYNNSLASLRLFATTADAQFGNRNGGFGALGNGGAMGLLGGGTGNNLAGNNTNNAPAFGSAGSENGTNSDIDSNALDEFLKSLDEMYLNPSPDGPQPTPSTSTIALAGPPSQTMPSLNDNSKENNALSHSSQQISQDHQNHSTSRLDTQVTNSTAPSRSLSPILGPGHVAPSTSTERFLLTAADQKEGTRDERLNRVIRAKYDAGLLRPFNYIKGYERLNTWMERKWSSSGKHRTLRIISEFRPHFRNIAQSLTDMDLIFIEEAFERLLLDYDRVFSTMGIPACLWRRTGEIFKGNREFAALVGIPYEQLREGKLAIYELMTEDSAVNFWEKYGSIAFDPAQKAVLTSCVLVDQRKLKALQLSNSNSSVPTLKSISSTTPGGGANKDFVIPAASFSPNNIPEEARLTCTFSFTIRRDAYHIPNAIVGNFMPYDPTKVRL